MSKSPVKNRTKFSKEAETIIDLLAKTLSKQNLGVDTDESNSDDDLN